jgi:Domain of Unknown Function (DUF1080)
MRRALPILLPLLLGLGPSEPVALLKGADPAQFDRVGLTPDSIAIEAGEVRLTGKPFGYFATKTSYQDYILTFEYKYDRPEALKFDADFRGNSGVLLHLNGPPRVWPDCVQVQLAQADPGAIFAVGGSKVDALSDPNAQKTAVKAVGEWNKVQITSQVGKIATLLNGVEVARAEKAEPARGPIAWQSEGKPIRFREIKIQTLP